MMDAIVQLIRNGLCCIKDLRLFPDSVIHDPNHTAEYYVFPSPYLNKTTPLEVLIAITQLYACLSCTVAGFKLMKNRGLLKLRRLNRVAEILTMRPADGPKKEGGDDKDEPKGMRSAATRLVTSSLVEEASIALRNFWEGICVTSIGISFFWLFANSLHITESGWIGGVPALIYALIVMEVALLPLLYYMWKDARSNLEKAEKIKNLIPTLSKEQKEDTLTLENFKVLTGDWSPFWTMNAESKANVAAESKMFEKEILLVQSKLKLLFSSTTSSTVPSVEDLQELATVLKWEGYREYVYFILNFIAFYGYLLGIIVYYHKDEENQPDHIRALKLGMNNVDADWNGNFAGDFMWTVEPVIILLSPMLIKFLSKSSTNEKKEKSD